jgi:hypothetical protein
MQTRNNFGSNVGVNKAFGKLKMFSKYIQLTITSDETDERDGPIRNIIDRWQTKFRRRQNWRIPSLLDDLERSFAFKIAISMVLVMKELKVLGLGSELAITPKPLSPKEPAVVSIIKALHSPITPRLPYGDEHNLDPQRKAEPEDDTKGTRVAVASTKTELVVDLKEIWDSHGSPTTNQSQSHGLVVFSSLRVDKDAMTV